MSDPKTPGTLFLVPTPIGNLSDMTFRAVDTLKAVSLVACEDTRTSGVLLNHYGIETPRTSLHAHNEHGKVPRIVEKMILGDDVALISDAGTPGISDPGYLLTRAALDAHLRVEALPGATALIPALAASGLPTDKFVFEGFLPPKKGRQTRIKLLVEEDRTVVFYESPHRLGKLLTQLASFAGDDRQAVVAREISKKFEEYARGSLEELIEWATAQTRIRGECVVLLASRKASERINP
ncbi:MAG: 16S rRNA (cytidine(1402)-2'-O)-methyltransferase [Bacteroidetes Order II. Incertae sedis bacterium]|jgi:16S rRNA (cytidine1402-2'-O)-methyltransferase|nr:16S rRNA (cytidine(1402)-2'-O)-methyltransferase [Bacteroidetes Order II. bacterium]MDG1753407.1 16S rRNA (cytidine(1402)-2'-O)-methyltransferase [Rhodothermales bacterium]HAY37335.1 16S rRNA (cytidine(1402)-2'-O)-methyltransferase [Bacteroidota bacterium]MBT4051914.1 16S rRNA (cytidine(1402)-2'-O)-methyltransferase [Bacteroidetes Order II. bacterium]MBT4603146.1 16S rRNA (cytidine(1402)-2'-O)-methyltransferase [Bacteroidetes Order II. bacterium]